MTIAAWPVVDRNRVVHAFKPGEPPAEGPFRTLRSHEWATAGVRVTRHAAGRLVGQLTVFSSLNVESARLARHGKSEAAERLARAAAQLEAGIEFVKLQRILSGMHGSDVERVVDGVLPEDTSKELVDALKAVARRTEQLRIREVALTTLADVIAGRISEVHEGYVVLVRLSGPAAMIPRWMAVAAQRDKVGELLALVTDRLDNASAVVEAVPAIDLDNDTGVAMFSPFGRSDARVRHLSPADARLLAGEPEPLRILVPVLIDA